MPRDMKRSDRLSSFMSRDNKRQTQPMTSTPSKRFPPRRTKLSRPGPRHTRPSSWRPARPGVEVPAEKVVIPGPQAIKPVFAKNDPAERLVQRFSDASQSKWFISRPNNARIGHLGPSWPVSTKKAALSAAAKVYLVCLIVSYRKYFSWTTWAKADTIKPAGHIGQGHISSCC